MIEQEVDDLKIKIIGSESINDLVGLDRIKKFNKLAKDMNKLISDIKKDFPHAQYLASENEIKLFIGEPLDSKIHDLGYGRLYCEENKDFEADSIFIESFRVDLR